ncbi:ComEC/Rec2 family competence protein [Chryseobacterium gossypii]|uniref:ComEC/Rec2 family competence protein n=1 Tax=Chryseobacterium gossypii TaxID=3231602 RepID=UPI0035244777
MRQFDKQPLLILVICFISGILFQDRFALTGKPVYLVSGFCFLILISTLFRSYFLFKIRPGLVCILFFGAGIVLHFFNGISPKNIQDSSMETMVFRITGKLKPTEKNKKYEAVVQVGKEDFRAVVFVPQNSKDLDFNHYYKVEAYITRPRSPQYDFQFDYAQYLQRKNIEYQCYIKGDILPGIRKELSFSERFLQKRHEILQRIDKSEMSKASREFLKGIILADRTGIDDDTVRDFNKSGLVHFLAISGTHIVVIFGIFYFMLIRIFPLRFRRYAVILSLVFIWLFAALIGFGNSVLRSCIMLSVYQIYVLLQRKPDLLHSLALSAFFILIFNTQQIFDVGFQLSFLAVFGIFWLNQPILNYFPKPDNFMKKVIFNTASISVSAQVATLPLVLYYFHQFSFISIVANLIIVPFSEIIIVFSFLMAGLIALGADLFFLNGIYDIMIRFLLETIHRLADSDALFFENIPMSLTEVLCLGVILYVLRFAILQFNFKNAANLIMAILAFFIVRTGLNIAENRREEILVHDLYKDKLLSVKKGDKACFWIGKHTDKEKAIRYIVNPYKASRRLGEVEIKTFPGSVQKVVYNGKIYDLK